VTHADRRATEPGLTWQYTRGSALLGWVKDDAEFIAERSKARARDKEAVHV
jgi:hypothetical protein